MKYVRLFFFYWLPTILWASTIFFFSARHHFTITAQSTTDFYIFKFLHMCEYAGLYFWLFRSIYASNNHHQSKASKLAFVITVLYAASDEIHQIFTPTREPRLRDVIIDTTGITIIYFLLKENWKRVKKLL